MTEQSDNATYNLLVTGDMLGDKVVVGESHIRRARSVFPEILKRAGAKTVVAVSGPSGSGKSEIGSLIGTFFIEQGKKAYVLSCDNYPKLPPRDNEKYREELFQQSGQAGLEGYLGTEDEIDFERLSSIVTDFKAGKPSLRLRIMDNPGNCVSEDDRVLDVSDIQVLVLEGTWSALIGECDVRLFLDADLQVTLEHRKKRARDPLTPFGELVLEIEQAKLDMLKDEVDFVVAQDGSLTSNGEFQKAQGL